MSNLKDTIQEILNNWNLMNVKAENISGRQLFRCKRTSCDRNDEIYLT